MVSLSIGFENRKMKNGKLLEPAALLLMAKTTAAGTAAVYKQPSATTNFPN
jgi:hypothetical protein